MVTSVIKVAFIRVLCHISFLAAVPTIIDKWPFSTGQLSRLTSLSFLNVRAAQPDTIIMLCQHDGENLAYPFKAWPGYGRGSSYCLSFGNLAALETTDYRL